MYCKREALCALRIWLDSCIESQPEPLKWSASFNFCHDPGCLQLQTSLCFTDSFESHQLYRCHVLKAEEYLKNVEGRACGVFGLLYTFIECSNLCKRVVGTSSCPHLGDSTKTIPQCPDRQ